MILLDRALEQHLYSQVITWVDASYDYIEELDRVNLRKRVLHRRFQDEPDGRVRQSLEPLVSNG